jgi:hypothetical protein
MALTTVTKLGRFLGITFSASTNPTSTQVSDIISSAVQQAYNLVTYNIVHERIDDYVPSWTSGKDSDLGVTNGTNTTFYLKHTPIADMDDSGTVDGSDITIDVLDWDTDTWSEAVTVTSVDDKYGKVVLASAPVENSGVWADYHAYVAGEIPDSTLMEALANNIAAREIWQNPNWDNAQLIDSYSVPGGLSITKGAQGMLTQKMIEKYEKEIVRLTKVITRGRGVAVG